MFQAEKLRQGTAILWYLHFAGNIGPCWTFQGIQHFSRYQTPNTKHYTVTIAQLSMRIYIIFREHKLVLGELIIQYGKFSVEQKYVRITQCKMYEFSTVVKTEENI